MWWFFSSISLLPCSACSDLAVWLANCYFAHDSSGFPVLLPFFDAPFGRSVYPFLGHAGPPAWTWWRPFPSCGVASPQASAPDLESLPATIAESIRAGPHPCRLDGDLGGSNSSASFLRSAILLKPSTLLGLHKAMSKQKYRMLFSLKCPRKPGPKGPSPELIHLVVEMKQRNPNWGCPRIAQQITFAFNIQIDKDVVRRILAHHYRPGQNSGGPPWLTFLGHMKDSLWSIDLFRCESATLRTHWVLVVMDQFTRRIIGLGVQAGTVDGGVLCRMFNHAIQGQRGMPKYLSSDHDPLYRFPPMAGQLADTGSERNQNRPLRSPSPSVRGKANRHPSALRSFGSQSHCRNLYQTPVAA